MYRGILLISALVVAQACLSQHVGGDDAPDNARKQEIVKWMAHHEGLVRTMDCRYRLDTIPTSESNAAAIREVFRELNDESEYRSYVTTEAFANLNSYRARWRRKGKSERFESWTNLNDPAASSSDAPGKTTVGHAGAYRTLTAAGGELTGSIEAAREWNAMNLVDPFSLIYDFQNVPYSTLLERATEWNLEEIDESGRWVVQFRHPDFNWRSFRLTFNDQIQLIERQVLARLAPETEERIYEVHEFGDYTPFTDESGESITFPLSAVYHYFVGSSADRLVEYKTEQIAIEEVRFNPEIADDVFTLDFPAGTRIYDALNNRGWLDDPSMSHRGIVVPMERPKSSNLLILLILNGVVIISVLIVFFMRYSRPS